MAERFTRLDEEDRQRREAAGPDDAPEAAVQLGHGEPKERPLRTPFKHLRGRPSGETWHEAQSLVPSMRLAELGSSAYPYLDSDDVIILEYNNIAGGKNGVERFFVRVISSVAKLDVQEPGMRPLSDRARHTY